MLPTEFENLLLNAAGYFEVSPNDRSLRLDKGSPRVAKLGKRYENIPNNASFSDLPRQGRTKHDKVAI